MPLPSSPQVSVVSTVWPGGTVTVPVSWSRLRSWVCPALTLSDVDRHRTSKVAWADSGTSTTKRQPVPLRWLVRTTPSPEVNVKPGATATRPAPQSRSTVQVPAVQVRVVVSGADTSTSCWWPSPVAVRAVTHTTSTLAWAWPAVVLRTVPVQPVPSAVARLVSTSTSPRVPTPWSTASSRTLPSVAK